MMTTCTIGRPRYCFAGITLAFAAMFATAPDAVMSGEIVLPGEARGRLSSGAIIDAAADEQTASKSAATGGKFVFQVKDKASGRPLPCRIYVKDQAGIPQRCEPWPFCMNHFTCDGTASLELVPGIYLYEIECGKEYKIANGSFQASAGQERLITVELERIADLVAEGWYAGDLHNHRSAEDMPLLLRAENVHIGIVPTWWINIAPGCGFWHETPKEMLTKVDKNRFIYRNVYEDERFDGTAIYYNLPHPFPLQEAVWGYPPIIQSIIEVMDMPGVWIHADRPYWWEIPTWLALGRLDSMEVINNNFVRSSYNKTEAWGRPRDQKKYPPPFGNALYCQDLYYHMLNCGFRIPPAAGSASGVAGEAFAYNRAYVKVDGAMTWQKWWDGLRAGRCFITNGPLPRVTANGHHPGHVFKAPGGKRVKIDIDMQLASRDEVTRIEVVRNGQVVRSIPFDEWQRKHDMGHLEFKESGWFLVRVLTAHNPRTYRFAMTGPFYIEIGDTPRRISRSSAALFLEWMKEAPAQVKLSDPQKRAVIQKFHQRGIEFWKDLCDKANAK